MREKRNNPDFKKKETEHKRKKRSNPDVKNKETEL